MAKSKEPMFWVPPTFDSDGVQATSGIGTDGKEYPDPVPDAPLVDFKPPQDILRDIQNMILSQNLRARAEAEGFDTPEEAMDLDVDGEEPWPESGYEEHFWPDPALEKPTQPHVGNGRGAAGAAPLSSSQKVSEGLVSASSTASSPRKPIDDDFDDSVVDSEDRIEVRSDQGSPQRSGKSSQRRSDRKRE